MRIWLLCSALLVFSGRISAKELPLPSLAKGATLVQDVPEPFNLQAVVKKRGVALSWEWQPPEMQPLYLDWGYEIFRTDGVRDVVGIPAYQQQDLEPGTYTYKVRIRGSAKEHGKRIVHVSAWSEPVEAKVVSACRLIPRILMDVKPTRPKFESIASVRVRLTGQVVSAEGCTLPTRIGYRIDAHTGASHTGSIPVNANNRFDATVNALAEEEEVPSGEVTFTVTASAENEAGPASSDAYALSVTLENKYAPK